MPAAPVIDLSFLAAIDGFIIRGGGAGAEQVGFSVSNAGDVNGDGIDDMIFSAPTAASGAGETTVIYGQAGAPRGTVYLRILIPEQGFIIQGDAAGDYSGFSVSGAGDVNGDGIDDMIVGALRGNDGGTEAGEAYVVYGQLTPTRGTMDLSNLTAAKGFIIQGDAAGDFAGASVS